MRSTVGLTVKLLVAPAPFDKHLVLQGLHHDRALSFCKSRNLAPRHEPPNPSFLNSNGTHRPCFSVGVPAQGSKDPELATAYRFLEPRLGVKKRFAFKEGSPGSLFKEDFIP